jgi:enoyl-CoA hydratase/carnithine racemase
MKMNYKFLKVDVKDGIALITMNNPPVNQFSANFTAELMEAVNGAFEDDTVKALVLTGTGKNFIAGADITEVQHAKKKEEVFKPLLALAQFFNKIEINPKPVVAAINGNALGGGLELAMACHYRVAVKGVNLGQPEVQIGLIPGAGGTQRLPRLVGMQNALEMITTGNPIKSERALSRALVDEVVDEAKLLDAAFKAAGKLLKREIILPAL